MKVISKKSKKIRKMKLIKLIQKEDNLQYIKDNYKVDDRLILFSGYKNDDKINYQATEFEIKEIKKASVVFNNIGVDLANIEIKLKELNSNYRIQYNDNTIASDFNL